MPSRFPLLLLPSWMHFQFFQRADDPREEKTPLKAPGWINPIPPTAKPIIFPNQHQGPNTTWCSLLSAHFQTRFSQILGGVQGIKCPSPATSRTGRQNPPPFLLFPPHPCRGDPCGPGSSSKSWLTSMAKKSLFSSIIPKPGSWRGRIPLCSPISTLRAPGNPSCPLLQGSVPQTSGGRGEKPRNS